MWGGGLLLCELFNSIFVFSVVSARTPLEKYQSNRIPKELVSFLQFRLILTTDYPQRMKRQGRLYGKWSASFNHFWFAAATNLFPFILIIHKYCLLLIIFLFLNFYLKGKIKFNFQIVLFEELQAVLKYHPLVGNPQRVWNTKGRPGPPHHMIIHAKQTVLHLEKRYFKGRLFIF